MRLKWFGLVLLGGALVLTTQADAAARARVGILQFKGPGEGPVRAKVTKAIKANGFQIVGAKQLDSTAGKLGVSLDSDDSFRAVAKELNVSAFVTGELTKKKAALAVRNGADGAEAGQATFAGANPKKIKAAVAAGFWRQLGAAIKNGKPPSGAKAKSEVAEEAEPADDEAGGEADKEGAGEAAKPSAEDEPKKSSAKERVAANDDEKARGDGDSAPPPRRSAKASRKAAKESDEGQPAAADKSDDEGAGALAPVALELGVGLRAVFRRLAWHQDVQGREVPYGLNPGPEVGVWFELYPAAFVTSGIAAQIGLFGGFTRGFGVVSTTGSGAQLTTGFQDYLGGLKFLFPLGTLNPYLSGAYGQQLFQLLGQTGTAIVPAVNYQFIRLGGGARVNFTPEIFLDLDAAYLLVTDVGKLAGQIGSAPNFFPHASAYAFEAGGSIGYRLMSVLGVRVGADFRQYGLNFNVRQGETPAVGGATDRYITVWGGVELLLDGMGRHESAAAPAEEAEPAKEPPKSHGSHKAKKKAEPDEEDDDAG